MEQHDRKGQRLSHALLSAAVAYTVRALEAATKGTGVTPMDAIATLYPEAR